MPSKQISGEYLEKFRSLLVDLESTIQFDWENINQKFQTASWPGKHKSAIMLAVPVAVRDQCMPFQPVLSFTAPPNHVSKKLPVLEFKLLDGDRSSMEGTRYFPVSLSLFESGRQILKIYGLTLDTARSSSNYQNNTLLIDKRMFGHLSLVMKLIKHMIENFPVAEGDGLSTSCRTGALADLSQRVRHGARG